MRKVILLLIVVTFFVACESTKRDYNEIGSLPVKVIENLQTDTIPNFVSYKYTYEEKDYYFDKEKKLIYVQDNSDVYIHISVVVVLVVMITFTAIVIIVITSDTKS